MKKFLALTFITFYILAGSGLPLVQHLCQMTGNSWSLTVAHSGHDRCMHSKPEPTKSCCHTEKADASDSSSPCRDNVETDSQPTPCCHFEVHKFNTDNSILTTKVNPSDPHICTLLSFDSVGRESLFSSMLYLADPPLNASKSRCFPLLI